MHLEARRFFEDEEARLSTYAGGYQDPVLADAGADIPTRGSDVRRRTDYPENAMLDPPKSGFTTWKHDPITAAPRSSPYTAYGERRVRPLDLVGHALSVTELEHGERVVLRQAATESLLGPGLTDFDASGIFFEVETKTGMMVMSGFEQRGVYVERSEHTFHAKLRGEAIRELLPDIRLSIPPMIDFGLHELADHPDWTFRVRHVNYNGRWPSHPKMCVAMGGHKNVYLKLKLPQRLLYWNIEEVAQDLAATRFEVSVGNYALSAVDPETVALNDERRATGTQSDSDEDVELMMLRRFNRERYERQRQWPDEQPVLKVTPDNVVSLLDKIERRRASATSAGTDRAREFLRKQGG